MIWKEIMIYVLGFNHNEMSYICTTNMYDSSINLAWRPCESEKVLSVPVIRR
jgi:hypothetical protein